MTKQKAWKTRVVMILVFGLLTCLAFMLWGCRTMPEYFYENQGKIVYEANLVHPYNSFWFTVYGYTLPNGEIHLKRMNPIDYLLTLGTDVKLHEQAHSFEFIVAQNRPEEWRRFKADFNGDMEDFAHAVTSGKNPVVERFVSGGYMKGE